MARTPLARAAGEMIEVEVQCVMCKKTHIVKVPKDGYRKWLNGALIQNAMPEVPPAERELLISNICGTCFDQMFGEQED